MSDWYDHEFGKIAGRHKHPSVQWPEIFGRSNLNLPRTSLESKDWRNDGVILNPKSQG